MRFKKLRCWLIERIIRWLVIPLAGRGVQVQRQDARREGLHHAPMCGANHYHHMRPITSACTCGAERAEKESPRKSGGEDAPGGPWWIHTAEDGWSLQNDDCDPPKVWYFPNERAVDSEAIAAPNSQTGFTVKTIELFRDALNRPKGDEK